MSNRIRDNVKVDILLDLDYYFDKYGPHTEKEPDPKTTRVMVDDHRTYVLRELGKSLFCSSFYEGPHRSRTIDEALKSDHVEYVLDYLKQHTDQVPLYYMNLRKSKTDPNLFFLDIVLRSGFISHMKVNPSERYKIFLQEILQLLYENGLVDREIVGYYLKLSLNGTDSFEKKFDKFLTGEL